MNKQQISWARISAEGAAIVVSILLAFAIDAAWQHRGEVAEQREILVGEVAPYLAPRNSAGAVPGGGLPLRA